MHYRFIIKINRQSRTSHLFRKNLKLNFSFELIHAFYIKIGGGKSHPKYNQMNLQYRYAKLISYNKLYLVDQLALWGHLLTFKYQSSQSHRKTFNYAYSDSMAVTAFLCDILLASNISILQAVRPFSTANMYIARIEERIFAKIVRAFLVTVFIIK